jgi:uncharacterized PurR-regulated membrane protein YhhQ (DUF165 family)
MIISFGTLLKRWLIHYPSTLIYILLIICINNLFIYAPALHIGQSEFSSADYVVGIVYILRDFSQREVGHKVIYAMIIGCVCSYALAEKQVAIASVASFTIGEILDWAIYTYTRKPLSQRLLLSTFISAPVDSVVFLYFMAQLNMLGVGVLTASKMLGILAVWGFWRIKSVKTRINVATSA